MHLIVFQYFGILQIAVLHITLATKEFTVSAVQMVTLLFLFGFSEMKNTEQALLNEIMVHFRAHWVVSMSLIGSGLGC